MRSGAVERLGAILLHYNLVSERALEEALAIQKRERGRLGEILVRLGHLTERELTWSLANQLDLPCVSSIETRPDYVDKKAVKVVPRHLAYEHHVLPVIWNDDELTIVTDDPLNTTGLKAIEKATGLRLNVATGPTSEILQALDALYGPEKRNAGDGEAGAKGAEEHPLALWLGRARTAGYRRMVVDPGGKRGRPTVCFQGYPGETNEITLEDYRAIMRALREASGHKTVLGPTLGPFKFHDCRGVVAFAHTRGGLAASINLRLPGEDVAWPSQWHAPFREGIAEPGLWLVGVSSNRLWEPFTYFVQEAFEEHGRVMAGGLVQDGPLFPRQVESYSAERVAALFSLEPEVILFPASARTALLEHLRAGRPDAAVMLQVAARDPVRALQVFQGYGASGPETAEMVRGVLTVHGIPRTRRGGRRAGDIVPVLGWYKAGPAVERFLIERPPSPDLLPLFEVGPIPRTDSQIETLVAKGTLTRHEANILLQALYPTQQVPADATVAAPEVCNGQY